MVKHTGIVINTRDFSEQWLICARDAGLDTLGLHPGGGKDAAAHLERAISGHSGSEAVRLRALAARMGLRVEYEEHVLSWLLPKALIISHADWFRVDERGERVADYNMCASNEEALEFVGERARKLASVIDTGGHAHFYWTDDVSGHICHCARCAGLSAADQALRIVNAMARGLRAMDSRARVSYLAYYEALALPSRTEPEEGVFLEYAPIRRDSRRFIFDTGSPENAREAAPIGELLSFFGKKHSRVLEYWVDNSRFCGWKRPLKQLTLDATIIERDAEFYARAGFEEITSFACFLGDDYLSEFGEPPITEYGAALARGIRGRKG